MVTRQQIFDWAKSSGTDLPTSADGNINMPAARALYQEKTGKSGGSGGNTGLPFGLCEKYGISLPENATPKQAWDALAEKGIAPPWTERGKGQYEGGKHNEGAVKTESETKIEGDGSAKSSRTDADEKARDFLEKQGIDRYSRLERPQGITPATEVTYYRLLGALESGGEIDEKLSPETARKIASLARYNQAIVAKRILALDSTENPQRELDYFDYDGKIAAFAENVGQKSARKPKEEMTEEERKKKEAIDYFKAHYDPNRPQREITTSTYERAQARLKRDVENFLGRGLT